MTARFRWLAAALPLLAACHKANYLEPTGPRYAGTIQSFPDTSSRTLRVVSFNIKYADNVDSAIAVLTSDPVVMAPDLLLLQEMDSPQTQRVAEALGMSYVFYPAILRGSGRDFGNAVLSRWPIEEDVKIVLPHLGRFGQTSRTATGVTVRVGGSRIRVYSIHMATWAEIGPRARRNQADAVLSDARRYDRVIIGGDLNNHEIGGYFVERGYTWPTETGPNTVALGRWDHVLLRGLELADSTATGTVLNQRGASDHRPVWAVIRKP